MADRASPPDSDTRKAMAEMSSRMTAMYAEEQATAQTCTDRVVHIALGQTGVALLLGGSTDVVVTWSTPFPTDVYAVEIIPTGLIGKATWAVLSQTNADVTIRITATLALAIAAQFIVAGRS